jgi:pSer/pThr/pTyr-binding forkhead associated (FHA) protein
VPPPLPPAYATAEQSASHQPLPPAAATLSVPAPSGGGVAPPLYLVFGNQRYVIDKDQFIIGRGTKSSDLPIRDGNISRKHAVVIRRNGEYYIKDLGSTNGIDHNGERIEGKKIEEGDIFSICDYQLKFTYK